MEVLSLKSHRMSSIESARICTKSKLGLVQLWCSGSAVQQTGFGWRINRWLLFCWLPHTMNVIRFRICSRMEAQTLPRFLTFFVCHTSLKTNHWRSIGINGDQWMS